MLEMVKEESWDWDEEWVMLVAEARELGLSVEEVRSFFLTYTKAKS